MWLVRLVKMSEKIRAGLYVSLPSCMCFITSSGPILDMQSGVQPVCIVCWDTCGAHSWHQNKALYLIAPSPLNSSNVLAHLLRIFKGNEVTALERDHEHISIMWPNCWESDGVASECAGKQEDSHSHEVWGAKLRSSENRKKGGQLSDKRVRTLEQTLIQWAMRIKKWPCSLWTLRCVNKHDFLSIHYLTHAEPNGGVKSPINLNEHFLESGSTKD